MSLTASTEQDQSQSQDLSQDQNLKQDQSQDQNQNQDLSQDQSQDQNLKQDQNQDQDLKLTSASGTMRCVPVYFLYLSLWAELVAGRALLTNPELRSIMEDLLKALKNYSRVLKTTKYLEDLITPKCNDPALTWNQVPELTHRLIQNQACAEKLQPFSPDGALCPAILLNQDLLQHLSELKVDPTAECPSSSSSSPSPDINILTGSMQCVLCWRQQVAALLT